MGMRTGPALLAAAVLLTLAGCAPTESHASSEPSASATPVFSSDAEALAAAEKAYAAYLKVSDEIGHDGGKSPERIDGFVTKSRLQTELRGSKAIESRGIRTVGSTAFRAASLQGMSYFGTNFEVTIYACWDTSGVRILDASGNDVTPAGRVSEETLEVSFVTEHGMLPLRLDSDDSWSGPSSC